MQKSWGTAFRIPACPLFLIQPNARLNLGFQWIHNKLYRSVDSQKQTYYTVNVLNLQTTYQFNKYFFLRAALRFDDYREKLLTDFLASFTLIPGTVVHLGYGSLYLRREWQGDHWAPGRGDYINTRNGLFFKVSYLWQIK